MMMTCGGISRAASFTDRRRCEPASEIYRRSKQPHAATSQPIDMVFLNICLGGLSSDDSLDGSPSGLVSGFLRAGARVVIAALPPVPDLWAFVLGLLVTHELAGGEQRAEVALARAKERLTAGDWPESLEPAFRNAFEEVVVPRTCAHRGKR